MSKSVDLKQKDTVITMKYYGKRLFLPFLCTDLSCLKGFGLNIKSNVKSTTTIEEFFDLC